MSPIASLVFGMAPGVAELIARLSPCDVDRVVVNEAREMRPRWENRPLFWKDLFHAAAQTDDQARTGCASSLPSTSLGANGWGAVGRCSSLGGQKNPDRSLVKEAVASAFGPRPFELR